MTTRTILIVEDDHETGDLIARYLREHSFSVGVAPDGSEMDRYMSQNRVDLIVLDVMLPGEDGLGLCRRLRAVHSTPVIFLTTKGDEIESSASKWALTTISSSRSTRASCSHA